MSDRALLEFDGTTGEATPIPTPKRTRYRCKLDTLQDVKSEMARLYREARSGIIGTQECSRLVYVLKQIADVTVNAELEKRIEALEGKQ